MGGRSSTGPHRSQGEGCSTKLPAIERTTSQPVTDSLSPKLLAVSLLFAGVLVFAGASHVSELVVLLLGLDEGSADSAQMELAVTVVGLGLGSSLMGLGVYRGSQIARDRTHQYQPYVPVLEQLAAEFGARLEQDPREGLGFVTSHHGSRLEVLVQPIEPARTRLFLEHPAQQRLMVLLAHGVGSDLDDAEWRRVGRRGAWVLRAPMPGLARPLLDERDLAQALDHLCSFEPLIGVRHDQLGVEVLAGEVPPAMLRDFLRAGLDVARVFQTRNGV